MIKLQKFEQPDFDRLIQWIDSETSMIQFSGPIFDYPLTYEQLEKYIQDNNRLVYKVLNLETGEVIGHAELNSIDYRHNNARICRILVGDKLNRNKGYGKAIINALVHIGFSELHLHRLDLGVFDFNHQAIECYKKCGFQIEGLLKDKIKVGNEYWSVYNMSIINNEN